jgi:hypothetical protein
VRLIVVILGLLLTVPVLPTFAFAALASALVGVPVVLSAAAWGTVRGSVPAVLRRTMTLMGGNLAAALLITGAPVLVSLAMAALPAEEVGTMQSAIVVSRFPLMALLLIQSLLVPVFARRRSLLDRRDYPLLVALLLAALPVASIAAYLLGPLLLRIVYGSQYAVGPGTMALLTLGATALGGTQVLIALAVSSDHHKLAVIALPAALAVTVLVIFVSSLPPELAVPVGFAIGPLTGIAISILLTSLWRSRAAPPPALVQ